MNAQEEFWKGSFGDEYLKRNRVDWKVRRSFWDLMLEKTGARSVLEVGANAGWNLLALRDNDPTVKLRGVDLNPNAIAEARANALDVREVPAAKVGECWPKRFDLVFTAGVLIHVATDDLQRVMSSIVGASSRWVLAVEYDAVYEQEIDYRGHAARLWKRPFGLLYEIGFDLELEATGELGAGDGFDSCTYWLLRKGDSRDGEVDPDRVDSGIGRPADIPVPVREFRSGPDILYRGARDCLEEAAHARRVSTGPAHGDR
jgi:pseudaminic acid biosynthesis-associated methylase